MPILTYPAVFHAPVEVTPLEFHQDLWHWKTKRPWVIVQHYLHDAMFSGFDRTQTCDGQMDIACVVCHASIASHGKN